MRVKTIFVLAGDESPNVRLSFIWASENIATNTPEAYENSISVFEKLLDDKNVRVRIEAPEMFRVLGKRKPEYVSHCLGKLDSMSKNDVDRVVRIHAQGAIKAISSHSSIALTSTPGEIRTATPTLSNKFTKSR